MKTTLSLILASLVLITGQAYAQKGQNIVRASCVGCGICATVCPRGVLKLENGSVKDRVDNNPFLIGNNSTVVSGKNI